VRAECAAAALRYRFALPREPLRGRAGAHRGRGIGASLDFMEFRDYVPGDDLRRVDWRAYARTDELNIRLYREEVAPRIDLWVDPSRRMEVTAAKAQARADLADAITDWCRRDAGGVKRLGGPGGVLPLAPFTPRALRVWISDFLFAEDPAPLIRRFAAGAARICVLQLLDPWELEPTREGLRTLVDIEEEDRLDLDLDAPAIARYKERLARLRGSVERAVRSAGGAYALVPAAAPETMFREALLPQGLLEAR